MKNHAFVIVPFAAIFLLAACASTPSGKNWKENKRRREMGMPSKLKPDAKDVPVQVRQIEEQIDRKSVILANEATIYVSKNYEFDISLTGDDVSRDLDGSKAKESVAKGAAMAYIRNLKIKCERSIRVKIADFGTKPFIKISARGHCSHIILGNDTASHDIKRAQSIRIDNADLRYFNERAVSATGNNN